MKIVEKNKDKKQKVKKKPSVKTKKEQILIVAQEIKFARLLAGNEKKNRDRALKTLKKWLLNCFQKSYDFKEDDFTRIWKGLFYAVWMSDKPLLQEELCENIAGILDLFPSDQLKYALLMVKVGLRVLATEWYGIDHHRMDKCLMLVRRYLRGSLRCLRRSNWSLQSCKMFAKILSGSDGILSVKTPVYARNATSMILHVVDCYLEEIAKVSEGDIALDSLSELVRPLCAYICSGELPILCTAARRALTSLLRQSTPGLKYQDRMRAWEKMGCPEGGPDALVSDEEEETNEDERSDENRSEKALDPRAGRVDVELPLLPVPCHQIVAMLKDMMSTAGSKAHKRARICLQRFQQLSNNEYPLRIQTSVVDDDLPAPQPLESARSLQMLEKKLVTASDELALRGLSRKHRKRLLAKSRAGLSIVEDVKDYNVSSNSATGDWKVEETHPQKKKTKKEDTSNKENVIKTKKLKRKLDHKQNGDHSDQNVEVAVKKQKLNKSKKSESKLEIKKELDTQKIKKNITKTESKMNGVQEKIKNAPSIIKDKKKSINEIKVPENLKNNKKEIETKKTVFDKRKIEIINKKNENIKNDRNPTVIVNKVKNFQKQLSPKTEKFDKKSAIQTPKKVKFVLKNNSMQGPIDYYKSVRQSPNIPYDGSRKPSKTNLKPAMPSPINPFFKKKMKLKNKN